MHCISTQGKNRTPQRKRLSFVYFTFLFLFFLREQGFISVMTPIQRNSLPPLDAVQLLLLLLSSFDQESNNSTSCEKGQEGRFQQWVCFKEYQGGREGRREEASQHTCEQLLYVWLLHEQFTPLREPYEAGAMLQVRTARLTLGSYLGQYPTTNEYGMRDWHGICEPSTSNPGWGKEEKQEGGRYMRKLYP